ncbi:MAG: glycosyltransferase family 2 protein [Cucumibacter sp.]
MQLSIVIPAFNEQGNIAGLVSEIVALVEADMLGEIIVVDDASTDGTASEVASLLSNTPQLRCLRHRRHAGQSAALLTGARAARFAVIATLDGDGQNDPRDIATLVSALAAPGGDGPALVGGIRARRWATGSKRTASRVANTIRRWVLRDDCPDTGCGIKVMWRDALVDLPAFRGIHRYLPALFLARGYKTAYLPVNDRPRRAGVSKYSNFNRALIGLYDLVGVGWLLRRMVEVEFTEDARR